MTTPQDYLTCEITIVLEILLFLLPDHLHVAPASLLSFFLFFFFVVWDDCAVLDAALRG